jgi:uncharacterized damage-inducible protein DinB
MNQVEFITDQLKRSYSGEAWHGPSIEETLRGITAEQALAKPVPGAHSIWELTMHIGVWISASRRRLSGDTVEPTPEQDWPPMDGGSPEAWRRTLDALEQEHNQLQDAIRCLPESSLENQAPGRKHSIAFMLHGVIQHNLYHAGQIGLIKRALSEPRTQ